MAHPSEAPAPAQAIPQAPQGDATDPDGESPGRSFLTRLREVFSPAEDIPATTLPPPAPAPSLVNLRRLRVEDVAVPTAEIVAVPVTITLPELVDTFRRTGFTRIPVYEGSLDRPLGLVNLKDMALRHGFSGGDLPFDLRAMLRPLLFVPESMQAGVLLRKMQAERTHMAIVVDEWGGTDGLVTIEDLIETVVGAIADEHDTEEDIPFQHERDGSWTVQAGADLEDLCRAIGHSLAAHEDIDAEEVETVGGLVLLLAGHMPVQGETVLHPEGWRFEVIEADPRRLRRLRLWPPAPDAVTGG
ncbi:MAG: HlyC/CorC family transporter [Rubellimicrobium sp.]|nr:HlyC/CorC family transporter [Rubellimicrobium sp.]